MLRDGALASGVLGEVNSSASVGEYRAAPPILMIHPDGGVGGPGQTFIELVKYLSRAWRLTAAVPDGVVAAKIQEVAPSARLVSLPTQKRRVRSWVYRSRAVWRDQARDGRPPALVHANGLSALNIAGPIALRYRIPVLVHFHASELPHQTKALLNMWLRLGVRMVVMPVSELSRSLLAATSARECIGSLLPNPVSCEVLRATAHAPHAPFRVGFIATKAPRKGLHLLVEVSRLLRGEEIEWHIFGIDLARSHTAYLDWCLEEINSCGLANRFRWWGKVKDPVSAYRRIDALLIASSLESFCRPAAEAMAAGLPVVAPDIGGVREVVWDQVSGVLYDLSEPEQAAEQLKRIARDASWRLSLKKGAKRAALRFDIGKVGMQLERSYDQLLMDQTRRSSL